MKSRIVTLFAVIRYLLHIIVYLRSKDKGLIDYEIKQWFQVYDIRERQGISGLVYLLRAFPHFRSLFYFRTGANWLQSIARGQNNLEFYTESENIGKGLVIWHGFSTVINVRKMGENCQIWQNVTIGKKTSTSRNDRPIIGDNVKICAGAIVVGEIELNSDVVVGAGAIVVKDVPVKGTSVVAQPARYI